MLFFLPLTILQLYKQPAPLPTRPTNILSFLLPHASTHAIFFALKPSKPMAPTFHLVGPSYPLGLSLNDSIVRNTNILKDIN